MHYFFSLPPSSLLSSLFLSSLSSSLLFPSSHATISFFYPAFHLLTSPQLQLFYFFPPPSASHLPSPPFGVPRDSPLTFKESDLREPVPFTYTIITPLVRFRPSVKDGSATLAPLMCNPSHMAVRYEARALGEDLLVPHVHLMPPPPA